MNFLNVFKHLLPRAKAWNLTKNKQLRQFFSGLAGTGDGVKSFLDDVWLDIFPETTREISKWEAQFALKSSALTESERRDRLAAAWRAIGGQDPEYIQKTLRDRGFDVYVHEWWEPGTEPTIGVHTCVTPRNPTLYLRREFVDASLLVDCGEALAQCGEAFAEAGNSVDPRGYPLVNKILDSVPDITSLCGEALMEAGEEVASCGYYIEFIESIREYIVPTDETKWPYFLYIGGENFGTISNIDPSRKNEFEELCLKICPTHLWLGILVEYN